MNKKSSDETRLRIGCCGFGMAQAKYFEKFDCVEIQQTFYQPPSLKTLAKWRENAPARFEFGLKAWQLVTHASTSPTYRRMTQKFSASALRGAGEFKSSAIVREAWAITLGCADALKAKTLLVQCPASFNQSERHVDNMRNFFSNIERPKNIDLYWEPRGDWQNDVVDSLCIELGLTRAVDPFLNAPAPNQTNKYYFRLHGNAGWKYNFNDADQNWLTNFISEHSGSDSIHIFFNNVSMVADALELKLKLAL